MPGINLGAHALHTQVEPEQGKTTVSEQKFAQVVTDDHVHASYLLPHTKGAPENPADVLQANGKHKRCDLAPWASRPTMAQDGMVARGWPRCHLDHEPLGNKPELGSSVMHAWLLQARGVQAATEGADMGDEAGSVPLGTLPKRSITARLTS